MASLKSTKPRGAPALAKSKIAPARQAAFEVLRELARSNQTHSDDLLQGPKLQSLSSQDRNLCTALVMGVLRWQLSLDMEIAKHLTHKSRLDEPVRIALRMGVFQLLMMDRIPVHAAISDSVELTKRAGHRFASGLVNAVLRKFATDAALPENNLDAQQAHPQWLRDRWLAAFGHDGLDAICRYDQQQPVTVLRMQHSLAPEQEMSDLQPGAFLTAARRIQGPASSAETLLRVQDEGSQLIAEILGRGSGARTLDPASILDCCAAPGGKTAILAERFPNAHIAAWDISAHRLAAMRERFQLSPSLSRIDCRFVDAASAAVEASFDLILCDVPCSGTGTLARNPEIKLRLQPEDLARQQQRQARILAAALRHLAPGGRLLYSTCSLEKEENEEVIRKVLHEAVDVRLLSIAERLNEMHAAAALRQEGLDHLLEHAIDGDFLRTIPGISPCDGFFAALMERASSTAKL